MGNRIAKNPGNQPLYLNLPGGRSLKIPARGQAEIEEEDLNSSEVALHQSRGNIILVEAAAAAGEQGDEQEGWDYQDAGDEQEGWYYQIEGGQSEAATSPQYAAQAEAEEGGEK